MQSPYASTLAGLLRFIVHGGYWAILILVLVAAAATVTFRSSSREHDAERQAALELDRW